MYLNLNVFFRSMLPKAVILPKDLRRAAVGKRERKGCNDQSPHPFTEP